MSEAAPKSGEYHEGKLWFTRKLSVVTIGLTSLAVDELGQIEDVSMPGDGDDVDKGDVVVTVEGTNGSLEVVAPAAGIVQEINETAQNEPSTISEDPLEEGWLIKIEIQDSSDLKEYKNAAEED